MKVLICKNNHTELLRPLAEKWLAESNASSFGLKADVEQHLKDMLNNMVYQDGNDLLILQNDKDEVVGYMGLSTFKSPISDQLIANEHNYYVRPESRGAGGLRLLIEARKWAKGQGCSHLIMNASNLASDLHDKVCTLYQKMNMKHFESSYISEV
jgi:GNAT superfamily N-acetyltransferase